MALTIVRSHPKKSNPSARIQRKSARALKLFHEAAERVPAYGDFLKKHRIKHERIETAADFAALPLTDKPNYMSQYSLTDLSWDGKLSTVKYVSTSSGSTGVPSFWPRGTAHEIVVNMMIQKIYEDIVGTHMGSTLVVDSFALGQWIAGLEFYNATKWTAERGSHLVIVTPGIDKVEAVNEIKKLAPHFDRVVIGGYPPFIKDIIVQGADAGIDWKKTELYLLGGGEAVSELWRERLLERIGRSGDLRRFIVKYGMAECGIVANETPVSAVVRKALPELSKENPFFRAPEHVVGMYQFYPDARYFETSQDGSLALTSDAGLPLIRYHTRDMGTVLEYADVLKEGGATLERVAKRYRVDLAQWKLPFICLHGRQDFSVSFYALNVYVENIKRVLEGSPRAKYLSGLFTISVDHDTSLDQQLNITIELGSGVKPSKELSDTLKRDTVAKLRKLNTEYAKLYASIGAKAEPRILLVPYGKIETIHGRKHKWIKRS